MVVAGAVVVGCVVVVGGGVVVGGDVVDVEVGGGIEAVPVVTVNPSTPPPPSVGA